MVTKEQLEENMNRRKLQRFISSRKIYEEKPYIGEDEEECSKCGEIYSIWRGHECKPKCKRVLSTVNTGKF